MKANHLKLFFLVSVFVFCTNTAKAEDRYPLVACSIHSLNHEATATDSIVTQEEQKANEALNRGDCKKALVHLKKALEIYEKTGDSTHIADRNSDIAYCMSQLSFDPAEVIRHYRVACHIYTSLGKNIKLIDCLYLIRETLFQQGMMEEYADVSQEIEQAIHTAPQKARYQLLGNEQYRNRNYEQATPYYEEAKALYEKDGYEDVYEHYASVCLNLMICYSKIKRYEEAIKMGNLQISLDEKYKKGVDPLGYYTILYTQVICYLAQNKIAEAQNCAEFALQKFKNHPNAFARNIPYALLIQINVDPKVGKYEEVFEYSIVADSILSTEFPEDDQLRLSTLAHRINALTWLERYREAVDLEKHKMLIKQDMYQNNPEEYKSDLRRLADIEAFSGYFQYRPDMDSAKLHLSQYIDIEISAITKQAPWLTSLQRNALWPKAQKTLLDATGFAVQAGATQEPLVEKVYNARLLSKGLLLQTERALTETINTKGSEADKEALRQLIELHDSLNNAIRRKNIAEQARLQNMVQTQENRLLKTNAELADYAAYIKSDFKTISASLQAGEVLVDFLEVQHTQNNDNSITAFILRPEWEYPHLMRVCRCSEIYKITQRLNASLYEDSISTAFRKLVLDSVLCYVNPGETLYYVPDGILHNVSLENLKTIDGRTLSEVYSMRRLSSAKEVERIHADAPTGYKQAVLYGALNYGKFTVPPSSQQTGNLTNDERGLGDAYESLKGTEFEINKINSTLKKSKVKTTCYRDDKGTEESFMALNGCSPDVIHLATHGYYLSQEQAQKVKGLSGHSDAMQLSGVVMSNGNAGWLNIPIENGTLDGLLSAQDIAGLDLSGTRLVVLSACKTASGQSKADGIFGLQRAFKKAGAGALIMTLWGVNDKVTALFMTTFYQEIVKNKWNRFKAFGKAKQLIKQQYPEPYYWAGFIMQD